MADVKFGNLHAWDVVVLVLYLAGSLLLGIYTIVTRKSSIQHMFLAGRAMTWWPIGFSLFASNIGAANYVGIAGDAAATGFAVVMFEWNIYTMPEYLARRFGGKRLRIYLSVIALLTYIFSTLSADLYSGAVFINQSLKLNIYAGVAILLGMGLVFNGFGGLKTVLITDSLAVVVMVIGGVVLCAMGFAKVGGLPELEYKYMHAVPNTTLYSNTTCGYPPHDAWHVFRHPWHSSYPSVGLILRTTLGSIWYWCANQVVVQRTLAAKNITHAMAGCLFASYLKLLPFFIMVFPGMISRALYPDEVACATPESCMEVCGSEVGCSNIALPKLVIELLPTGLKGLMVASVVAAVISSLTSIFNSASAIFTLDIWTSIRKEASQTEMIIVGRVFVLVMVAMSILWIPMMSEAEGGKVFAYLTSINGYLAAPTCAMFLLAMFWKRVNEEGAFWGMILAQAWGMTRFVLDMVYPAPVCSEPDLRPRIIAGFHGYYHTISQIALAFLAAAVISCLSEVPPKERIAGLTYWTRFQKPHEDTELENRRRTQENLIESTAYRLDGKMYIPESNGAGYDSEDTETGFEAKDTSSNCEVANPLNTDVVNNEDLRTEPIAVTKRSIVKHWLLRIFCGPKHHEDMEEDNKVEEYESRLASIKQPVFWKNVMNINAIVMMLVTVFLYGVFY